MKVGQTTSAIAAGLVATLLMALFMEALPRFGYPHVDVPAIIGENLTGSPSEMPAFGWWLGLIIHLGLGIVVFPLLYVALRARLKLSWPPLLTGWLFGLALFLVGEGVLVPLTGGGFFSSGDPDSSRIVTIDFLSHSLYGLVLGALSGPSSPRP